MNFSVRKICAAIAALLFGLLMVAGMIHMPDADEDLASYGLIIADISVDERNAMNTVSGVLFDFRSLDTLGELLALFAASAGMHILFRRITGEKLRDKTLLSRKSRPNVKVSDTIRAISLSFAAPITMYGIYICVRGHLTIGGGFQGGVILASALFLLYLAGQFRIQEKIAVDEQLDLAETIGMGGVVLIGLVGLIMTGSLFENILPIGEAGALFSAGIIPILSILVGLEAAAAIALIVSHMQSQLLELEETDD